MEPKSERILPRSEYRRAAWKNGLGYTDEIAIHPPGAELRKGDFQWRISSARIEQPSAFSLFPEHDRILVVLDGNGLRLSHRFEEGEPEETVELPPLEVYEFPGDIQSRCELISGPVQDFSVFVRKGGAEAQVSVLELDADSPVEWMPVGQWNFLFAAQSGFRFEDGSAIEAVGEGDTLLLQFEGPPDSRRMLRALDVPCRVVLVTISHA